MHNKGFRLHSRLLTACLSTVGLVSLGLPANSVNYVTILNSQDYQSCAASLSGIGITETDVAAACAAALDPRDVSQCVVQIEGKTEIAATDALSGCRRARRPLDLATCVVDINSSTQGAVPLEVMDSCRRSLLPTRFSACVVGLIRGVTLEPAEAMSTCIAAGDRPPNVLPNFIPTSGDQPLRLTPLVPMQ